MFLGATFSDRRPLYELHFTEIFVHLNIIAAVSNFNVYKLIGWDLAFTCSKPRAEALEKGVKRCEICLTLINTAERRCDDFIVSFEHTPFFVNNSFLTNAPKIVYNKLF